jgi:HTH-type transcriptional regulator/antitoxin HigA
MSAARGTIDEKAYAALLSSALPRVIVTEEENERYIARLEALHDGGPLSPEEEQLSQLLTLLIEEFEDQHYQLQAATPVEILRELMEINTLNQSDLTDVFGNRSVVSEVLNGKRELSKTHIQKLSARFNVVARQAFLPLNKQFFSN